MGRDGIDFSYNVATTDRNAPTRPELGGSYGWTSTDYSYRTERYKIVQLGAAPAVFYLYDLETGSGETTNLAKSNPDLLKTTQDKLAAWKATIPPPDPHATR